MKVLLRWIIAFILLVGALPACQRTRPKLILNTPLATKRDAIIAALQDGDLVLRMGRDRISQMFAQLNTVDKSYSHCGLVVIENDYPFVYHVIVTDDYPQGAMHKDSAAVFYSIPENFAIAAYRYTLTTKQRDSVALLIDQYFKSKPRFDFSYDNHSDSALYCSELVAKVLNKATHEEHFIAPIPMGNRSYFTIDRLFAEGRAKLIAALKY